MDEKGILFSSDLDQQFLDDLYQGDAGYAVVVFANFLAEMPPMLNDCIGALQDGDIPVFKKAVHKVKPVFSYVGLTAISGNLEKLEQQCGQLSITELATNFAGIKLEIDKGVLVVQSEIHKLEAINKSL